MTGPVWGYIVVYSCGHIVVHREGPIGVEEEIIDAGECQRCHP